MDLLELLAPEDDRSWQRYANCMGVDPDLFFPERGAATDIPSLSCRDGGAESVFRPGGRRSLDRAAARCRAGFEKCSRARAVRGANGPWYRSHPRKRVGSPDHPRDGDTVPG